MTIPYISKNTMKHSFLLWLFLCAAVGAFAEAPYTSGVFILNEDWYGHNNSTLNHLSNSGEFSYRIVQAENEAPASLGCTAQFGAIYGDRFYFVSKQSQDPGESSARQGARLVVADATTLKIIYSIDTLFAINGKSTADGRGFVGVDESKGYIGSSNGIFVLDLVAGKITKRIAGTENSLITGNEQAVDGKGALYQNQIGMMLRTHDYVFAIQQDLGIHVIDPVADTIITTIRGCFSTMVQSKDGRIWAARNTNPEAQTYPYGSSGELWQGNELLAINPATLTTTAYDLRELSGNEDMMVEQTWYAWTAGSLTASTCENALFFSFTDNIWDWYNGRVHIYRFDIDNQTVSEIYTTTDLGDYYIYNSGMVRVSPLTGNIYFGCFKTIISNNEWLFAQLTSTGRLVRTYTPIKNYWFPALFVFPDYYAPTVSDFAPQRLDLGLTVTIPLGTMATDKDNLSAAITKRVLSVSNPSALTAKVMRDTLWLTALVENASPVSVVVRFNSNGKIVDKTLTAIIGDGGTAIANTAAISVRTQGEAVLVSGIVGPTKVAVYDMLGRSVYAATATSDVRIALPKGLYVIRVAEQAYSVFIR